MVRWKGLGNHRRARLAVWKFKFAAVLLLGKAKFLLLGLTKASTFLSMFLALGVYWTVFGGWLRSVLFCRFMSTRWATSRL